MPDAREVQALLVDRLRSVSARAGGWARADPYVLHYLVAHAEQAAPDDGDLTDTAVGELLGDPDFVARAEATRLARASLRFRGRVAHPTARLLERSFHQFAGLGPADRIGLLGLTAIQEGLHPGPPSTTTARWTPAWAAWQPSSPHVVLTGHGDWVSAVAFAPDGTVVASAGGDATLRLWDAATGEARATATGHGGWINGVAFSPDGTVVASAGGDATVGLWDAATGEARGTFTGHGGPVNAVAFSPGGAVVASAGGDATVRLWDAATGEARGTFTGHGGPVNAVAFSPDGVMVASGASDATVRLWDAAGEARATLTGHVGPVNAVAFSPDGTVVASGGNDATVRLWGAATAETRATLTGHVGPVNAVAFSPDGAVVASTGDDATVRLWDNATGGAGSIVATRSAVAALAWSGSSLAVGAVAGMAVLELR